MKNILFLTSTFPSSDSDPVPAFVKDEAIWFKNTLPDLKISVLAPHNSYSRTAAFKTHKYFNEYRFHYFWPYSLERLTGRGIQPALKKNKLLFFELPFLFFFEFVATFRLTRKLKPDLIYAHWFTPQAIVGAVVSKFTKTPLVFDTQASDAIVLKNVPFSKKIISYVCNQAYAYTAPSKQTADKLLYFATEKNLNSIKQKLHMVPYGTSPVVVEKTLTQQTLKKYSLKSNSYLYFIGRLVDRKGVDILIKAFGRLSANNQSLKLVIVGDGQSKEDFIKLAKNLGLQNKIVFTGYLSGSERFALLQSASVGVVPSVNVGDQSEGLPVVFMEGITHNKIMVITDETGAHEVAKDGVNAFISKAGSVESLHKKLVQAMRLEESEKKAFIKNVQKLAIKFQWQTIAKERLEAFQIIS